MAPDAVRPLPRRERPAHPPAGAPVSSPRSPSSPREEGERDPWVLAARYAAAMLPGIFRADDPAHPGRLRPRGPQRARGHPRRACRPSCSPPTTPSAGSTSSGRAKRKKEVNTAGRKIGGADLAPVTQLFTEHYMVRFLLENSLGAWWAARHPESPLLREWEYLRFRDDGTPAAGTFEGWPERAAEVTVMDPCCGSGHFLVAAFEMLRKMREEEEGLTARAGRRRRPADNLFGLELDARCTPARRLRPRPRRLEGRRLPAAAGPEPRLLGHRDQGPARRLAPPRRRRRRTCEPPSSASTSCSRTPPSWARLIDPRAAAGEGLWAVDPDELSPSSSRPSRRRPPIPPPPSSAPPPQGTAKAARLLAGRYWLVATNPPFLARGKQGRSLCAVTADSYPDAARPTSQSMFVCELELARHGGGPSRWCSRRAGSPRTRTERFASGCSRTASTSLVARLGLRRLRAIQRRGRQRRLCCAATRRPSGRQPSRALDAPTGKVAAATRPRAARGQHGGISVEQARRSCITRIADHARVVELGAAASLDEMQPSQGIADGRLPAVRARLLGGRWRHGGWMRAASPGTPGGRHESYAGRRTLPYWRLVACLDANSAAASFEARRHGAARGCWSARWGPAGDALHG